MGTYLDPEPVSIDSLCHLLYSRRGQILHAPRHTSSADSIHTCVPAPSEARTADVEYRPQLTLPASQICTRRILISLNGQPTPPYIPLRPSSRGGIQ